MTSSTRIPPTSTALPVRWQAPAGGRAPGAVPEQIEEIWDAVLVDDLAAPGWVSGPALSTYGRAGYAQPAPLVDLRA